MYRKAYGIIETLAPLHVGATAGEESGNLNLIFRDQFTQTGIVPGSSIRGRLRSEMRQDSEDNANHWYGRAAEKDSKNDGESENDTEKENNNQQYESIVKFEYASLLWLPVFCPGQPIVWVTSPKLLKRYKRIAGKNCSKLNAATLPEVYTRSKALTPLNINREEKLFFNFGFLTLKGISDLSAWFPLGEELPAIVVADDEIGMIHDMALYRQSRVCLKDNEKIVKNFFNIEALPEGTQMVFPIAIRGTAKETWQPFGKDQVSQEIYLGGLESIGFGNCQITLKGEI